MSTRKSLQNRLNLLANVRARRQRNPLPETRPRHILKNPTNRRGLAPHRGRSGRLSKNKSILSILSKVLVALLVLGALIWGIVFLYKRYKNRNKTRNLLNYSVHANKPFVIENDKIPRSDYGNEYTLSYWMYVNDWEFKNKLPKSILFRGDKSAIATNPGFWFFPENNNRYLLKQKERSKQLPVRHE